MSKENPWQSSRFAQQYAADVADPKRDWYEIEVNFPSIVRLIPEGTRKILDFGCGPGDFTAKLAADNYIVDGCDSSEPMLDIARHSYPSIEFFGWDFQHQPSSDHTKYDVVIAKLVVQFIQDLDEFAVAVNTILQPQGSLVISIPHPVYTAKRVTNYWKESEYHQEISKYGIYDTMIHRSLEQYATTFTKTGYVLTSLSEPQVTTEQLKKYSVGQDKFALPKRLNMRLQKI